jgi:cytochrome c oxidase subunit 2
MIPKPLPFVALLLLLAALACGTSANSPSGAPVGEAGSDPTVAVESGAPSPQNPDSDPAEAVLRGDQLSQRSGCRACHSTDGSAVIGPSWKGIYGKEEPLADGSSVLVDEAYIIDSIRNPGAKITDGFQDLMPAEIGANLTDEQISDIIEFIKSLE